MTSYNALSSLIFSALLCGVVVFDVSAKKQENICDTLGKEGDMYVAAHLSESVDQKKILTACGLTYYKNPEIWRYFLLFDSETKKEYSVNEMEAMLEAHKKLLSNTPKNYSDAVMYIRHAYVQVLNLYVQVTLKNNKACNGELSDNIETLISLVESSYSDQKTIVNQTRNYRALCFYRNNDYKKALSELDSVFKMDNSNFVRSLLLMSMAKIQAKQNDLKSVISTIEKSISLCKSSNDKSCMKELFRQVNDSDFDVYIENKNFINLKSKINRSWLSI